MGIPAFLFQPFAEAGQQTNDVEPIYRTRNNRNKPGLKKYQKQNIHGLEFRTIDGI